MERGRRIVVIQARMGSTRLSGKVMKLLCGKTVLAHDVERVRLARNIEGVVIATTIHERDDVIVEEAARLGVGVFRGSEDDVLGRYYHAACEQRADTIIRITSDCPLIDPFILDDVIAYYEKNQFAIVTNAGPDVGLRTFPRGLDVEVFSFVALEEAHQKAELGDQREHVTPYIYEHMDCGYVTNAEDYSKYRWTLDTEEDYALMLAIYQKLYHGKHDFFYKDVLQLMKEFPELADINKHVEQKR